MYTLVRDGRCISRLVRRNAMQNTDLFTTPFKIFQKSSSRPSLQPRGRFEISGSRKEIKTFSFSSFAPCPPVSLYSSSSCTKNSTPLQDKKERIATQCRQPVDSYWTFQNVDSFLAFQKIEFNFNSLAASWSPLCPDNFPILA